MSFSRLKSRTLVGSSTVVVGEFWFFEGASFVVFVFNKPVQAVSAKKVDISISCIRLVNLVLFEVGS